ncbi:zinc-ribbon domain-containing protein [Candidatus Poribacteria bacterium]|nr:zinc-ribbon domain-containing protein [Candidatus Poribacteria bacterium]
MQCPKCQHENPTEALFCMKCGTKLERKCKNCGAEYPAEALFCMKCGAKLKETITPPEVAVPRLEDMHQQLQSRIPQSLADRLFAGAKQMQGEYRLVTAIFADISGSSGMARNMPLEQYVDTMNNCFKTMVDIISIKYEGSINRFIGDCVLAFFGAPITHENDAERAILAALDIRADVKKLNLNVSIGINTGITYVGEMGSDLYLERSAWGPDVDFAKRLQDAAGPGRILIGTSTYRSTRKAFDFESPVEIEVKGMDKRQTAYPVLRFKEHPEKLRGLEGLRARMIGREREFSDLKEAADSLINGRGSIVTIIGEAGLGKSRLASELKLYLKDKEVSWYEGRSISIGQTVSYWPFLDILRTYLNLSDSDTEAQVAMKLKEAMTELFPNRHDDILPFIGNLLSVKLGDELDDRLRYFSPEQIRHQTLMRLKDVFTEIARQKPLLLILEDLHWGDDLSFDLISLLMDELTANPLLLLCIYRPEKEHRCWQLGDVASRKCLDRYTEITLKKLTSSQSRELVESLLAIDNLPESTKTMILRKSEGNPFFIEEVIRYLIDRGIVYREGDRWKATSEIDQIDVPDTIQSVVLSRVDRLASETKYVLQCASVIGRLFRYRLLDHISQQERDLERHLSELEDKELILEERTVPEKEYSFKHALTQETTYQGILQQRRREFHLKVAQGIEALYRERLEEYYEELAYHYGKSPDKSKALEYLQKAGKKCFDAYAMPEAIKYYTDAIGLAHEIAVDKEMIAELYQQRGEARKLIGEYEEQIEDYKEALKYTANKDYRAMLYGEIASTYRGFRADVKNATDYANLGRLELEGAGESKWTVTTYANIGIIMDYTGNEAREAFFSKGVEIAQRIGDKEGLLHLYRRILSAHRHSDDSTFEKLLALTSEVENPYILSECYHAIGTVNERRGNITEALAFYHQALELEERYSEVRGLSGACGYLGRLYTKLNELDKALKLHEQGWNATLKSRILFMVFENYPGLLQLYRQRGETGKILGMIEAFLDMMDKAMAKEETEEDSPFLAFLDPLEEAYTAIAASVEEHGWEHRREANVSEVDVNELRLRCQGRLEKGLERASNRMEIIWYLYQLVNFHFACGTPDGAAPYASRLFEMNPKIGFLILKPLLVIGDLESANEFVPGILQQPSVDYVKLASVDLFDGDSLSPVWEWFDPEGDCVYQLLSPSGLQITVPPEHGFWSFDRYDAPRLLQTIARDFAIETMISDVEGGKKSGGLLVWKDEDNYIRFDMPSGEYGWNKVFVVANVQGNIIYPPYRLPDAKILNLRLERRGHRFSAYCSMDDKNWFTCGWMDLPVEDPIQVGIHALCPWSPFGTSTRFEYVKIWRRDSE